MTDDPVRDAERYHKEQEKQWYEENRLKHCEICGRPCARLKHYEFDDVIVCDEGNCLTEAFRRLIIPGDILEDMAFEYEVMK